MEKLSPGTQLPTSRVHGDFWHRNILLRGDEVIVTDFAFSSPREPPVDYLDLICDYDASIFLDAKRLQTYSKFLQLGEAEIPFLHLHALIRKIGLKVERRKTLYYELVLNNLESSMNEISEVGIAKRFVRSYEGRQS
jgi:Ser/Thr protein kinase RdoA (MazF antagonist)